MGTLTLREVKILSPHEAGGTRNKSVSSAILISEKSIITAKEYNVETLAVYCQGRELGGSTVCPAAPGSESTSYNK